MKKQEMEFRYYEIPPGDYVMAMLGRGWEITYGKGSPREGLHFHNYMEIGYCYHGHGEVVFADTSHRYQGETFTVLPANVTHTTNSDPGNICKWEFLFFDIEKFIAAEMKDCTLNTDEIRTLVTQRGIIGTKGEHRDLVALILSILDECRHPGPYHQELLKGKLYTLVIRLLVLYEEDAKVHIFIRPNDYIRKSLEYIRQKYATDLRISDISDHCRLSESHFRRLFQRSTEMKVVDYINMVRIHKACEILEQEDVSIAEAGRRVGYQTPSSFNRNFRKLTRMTPMMWKRKALQNRGDIAHMHVSASPAGR